VQQEQGTVGEVAAYLAAIGSEFFDYLFIEIRHALTFSVASFHQRMPMNSLRLEIND
jgi:hypothetical protein